jgi:hypothetical protein
VERVNVTVASRSRQRLAQCRIEGCSFGDGQDHVEELDVVQHVARTGHVVQASDITYTDYTPASARTTAVVTR